MTAAHPLLPDNLRLHQRIVLGAFYGLIAYFFVASALMFERLTVAILVVWLVQIIPLIPFIPGLHRPHLRSYAWLTFVILLYFMHGVLVAFDPVRRIGGFVEVVLCVVLFSWLIVFIRQYREHYQVNL